MDKQAAAKLTAPDLLEQLHCSAVGLRPDRYDARSLLSISLALGTLTALFELAFFATLHGRGASVSQTSLYLFFSLTQLVVILSIRNRDHFWQAVAPSRTLAGAMVLTAAIALSIPYVGPLANLFSFHALPLAEVGAIILVTLVYVFVLDVTKVVYYKAMDSRLLRGRRSKL